MSYSKKLKKIVNKMTDDKSKNTKLILKNIEKIEKECKDSFIAREVVLTEIDQDKLLKFMDSYFEILKIQDVFGWSEKIRKFLGLDFYNFSSKQPLLHTLIEHGYSMTFIEQLLDVLNKNFATGLEKNSIYVYYLINKYNIINEHFVSYYLEGILSDKNNIDSEIDSLIRIIDNYSIDLGLCDELDENALGIVNKIEKDNQNIIAPGKLKELKKTIYKNSILTLLTYDKETDLEIINSIFGDINYCDEGGSLLHYCFKYPSHSEKNVICIDKYILERVYYLLSIGVNPNLYDKDGKSFIGEAINVSGNCNYAFCRDIKKLPPLIKEILTESNKYGYDISYDSSLFEIYLDKIDLVSEAIDMYQILCEFGYDSHIFRKDSIKIDKKYNNQRVYDIDDLNFLHLYTFNFQRDLLIYLLKKEKLEVEENFISKYNNTICPALNKVSDYNQELLFNDYNDFLNNLADFFEMRYIAQYFKHLVDTIIKLRNKSVIINNNKVTVKEILEALNYAIIEKENELNSTNNEFKSKKILYKYINRL